MAIKIPRLLAGKKYGLLLSDADAVLVSWHNGKLKKLNEFANSEAGVARFAEHLRQHRRALANSPIHILCNIIGEDYRVERVAHLRGRQKADFHQRRMHQLFRGSALTAAVVQGREEHGQRQDIVLFYGLLAENKIMPWAMAIERQGAFLGGIHAAALTLQPLAAKLAGGNVLLITLHEKGLMRQTYFVDNNLKFSRVAKIPDGDVESVATVARRELERAMTMINHQRAPAGDGGDAARVCFVCPGNLVGELREQLNDSGTVKFSFHDASAAARRLGLRAGIGAIGRDSSLALHGMFSYLRFSQLAKSRQARFYWATLGARIAAVALVLYGAVSAAPIVSDWAYARDTAQRAAAAQSARDAKQQALAARTTGDASPPSTPANIAAAVRALDVLSQLEITPTQLTYYLATALRQNNAITINRLDWFVSDAAGDEQRSVAAFFDGDDLFQTLEVEGEIAALGDVNDDGEEREETHGDVARRAEQLLQSFAARDDIAITALAAPRLSQSSADDAAANDRAFRLRIIWRSHSAATLGDSVVKATQ